MRGMMPASAPPAHAAPAAPSRATRLRRVLLPALFALPVLAVLVTLGNWQVERMHWKRDLLARIAAAEAAAPVPLRDPPVPLSLVEARGRFLHDREALVGLEVRDNQLGARLVVPLARADGPTVLVDRGWVPLERRRPVAHPEGEVSVAGYVHPGDERDRWAAPDDPAGRRFYTFSLPAIAAAQGLRDAAPYALVALAPEPTGAAARAPRPLPVPSASLPRPTDPHLGYAVTWYGTALALCGVFAVFAARRWKDPAR